MGLLDQLSNLSPEQSQGLLAAAASLLQSGGPSRMPTSLGQALGGGLTAYQQSTDASRKRKIEEAQAAQVAKLTGLKIQDAESDLTNQTATRDRAEKLRQFNIQYGGGGAPSIGGGGNALPAAGIGGGEFYRAAESYGLPTDNESLNKIVGLVNSGMSVPQAAASVAGKTAPTAENARLLQQASAQSTPINQPAASSGGGNQKDGIYQQRLAYAQALRNAGFSGEADAAEAAALKFQPKVKGWEKVQQGGKVMYAPFYEDGTSGSPVPLEVAEKLEKVNTGGTTDLVNPYTGVAVRSMKNTQTPDSIASVAATLQGQRLTDARGKEANQIARDRLSVDKAPTEFQGKSAAFGLRAREADKILTQLAAAGPTGLGMIASDRPGALKSAVGDVPLIGSTLAAGVNTLPTWAGGPNANQQKAEQAQRDFVNAVLRQESGAAIGETEFQNARQQYFPQPGDGPEVIAQKANNRQLAIQGFEANAGRAKLTAPSANKGWGIEKVD